MSGSSFNEMKLAAAVAFTALPVGLAGLALGAGVVQPSGFSFGVAVALWVGFGFDLVRHRFGLAINAR
jgi:hypothetical protein